MSVLFIGAQAQTRMEALTAAINGRSRQRRSGLTVLLLSDLFEPVDILVIECLLKRYMRYTVVDVAPCQCLTPAEIDTTSPATICWRSCPHC